MSDKTHQIKGISFKIEIGDTQAYIVSTPVDQMKLFG